MMSDFDNLNILLGNADTNPLERQLANATEGTINNEDPESNSQLRCSSSQKTETWDFGHKNAIPRQHRQLESM